METKSSKKSNVVVMTELALLTAIVILMAYTPLGYLRAGAVSITFIVVPVATAVCCIVPRILVGIVPALVFKGMTGCTVFLFDRQSPAGVDVRGGGPASRETPLLNLVADAKGIHAILLSGGSAFGLAFGSKDARPDQRMGYAACEAATKEVIQEGNVGAGCGCTVGKYHGAACMKSGIGTFAVQPGEIKAGAVVAVNALGDVYDIDTGRKLAGALDEEGNLLPSEMEYFEDALKMQDFFNGNTTLGVILTNAKMDKTTLNKVASMAHNGYGRAIRPVHTMADGDSIYAVSTGEQPADVNLVAPLAAYVMGRAIGQAVLAAKPCCGLKAACELKQ
ncbi:MAG: P1 family peptidase [Agathobacter sp.]